MFSHSLPHRDSYALEFTEVLNHNPRDYMNFNKNNPLLALLREDLASTAQFKFDSVKWDEMMTIASYYGLSSIAFDGLEKALEGYPELRNKIPKTLLMQWYGMCVKQTAMFKKNWSAACSLASLLSENSIEAVVLKGRSIAQYYPIPEHRYSCDFDLFVAGTDWERACEILEAKGIRLEYEVYKEVEFTFEGVSVELHRYITPLRGNNTLFRFER